MESKEEQQGAVEDEKWRVKEEQQGAVEDEKWRVKKNNREQRRMRSGE